MTITQLHKNLEQYFHNEKITLENYQTPLEWLGELLSLETTKYSSDLEEEVASVLREVLNVSDVRGSLDDKWASIEVRNKELSFYITLDGEYSVEKLLKDLEEIADNPKYLFIFQTIDADVETYQTKNYQNGINWLASNLPSFEAQYVRDWFEDKKEVENLTLPVKNAENSKKPDFDMYNYKCTILTLN